jgi:predicted ATPase
VLTSVEALRRQYADGGNMARRARIGEAEQLFCPGVRTFSINKQPCASPVYRQQICRRYGHIDWSGLWSRRHS